MSNVVKAIVSLTTHSVRTKNVFRSIQPIIANPDVQVVLNVHKDDYPQLTNDVLDLSIAGKIVIIVSSLDIGPHLKYFFAMKRFQTLPIIVIDDDIIYPDNFIDELLDYHARYPECILSRRPEKITFKPDGTLLHYHLWQRPYFNDFPCADSLATGVGGIMFPPKCFDLTDRNIEELLKTCKYDDDVYLKVLSLRNNRLIKSVHSQQMYKKILDDDETQSIALYKSNWNRTMAALQIYAGELKDGISRLNKVY